MNVTIACNLSVKCDDGVWVVILLVVVIEIGTSRLAYEVTSSGCLHACVLSYLTYYYYSCWPELEFFLLYLVQVTTTSIFMIWARKLV